MPKAYTGGLSRSEGKTLIVGRGCRRRPDRPQQGVGNIVATLPATANLVAPLWIILSKAARVGRCALDFCATSFALDVEAESERVGVVMAEHFDNNNVVMVASIIGGIVLLLGLWGVFAKFL